MAKKIVVAGDVIIDHNIYQGQRFCPDSKASHGTMVIDSPGGARLLYEIINELSKAAKAEVNTIGEYSVEFGINMDTIKDIPPHLHSYAVWSPCPTEKDPKETVWRMVQPLGYGNKEEGHPYSYQPNLSKQGVAGSDVIVLDDGALGFRFSTAKDAWLEAIRKGTADAIDWVVLKMSSPVAQGDLWRKLSKEFLEKLVVIISIGDIRNEEVMVTKGLSWERTAQDLLSELTFNARIRDLKKCRHLIINYRTEGALWMDNDKGRCEYHLVFDPEYLEGEWGNNIKGNAFGYISCLTAAIVNQLVKAGGKRDIGTGIISGLSAMRRLQRVGHGNTKNHKPAFPFEEVTSVILGTSGASSGYSIAKIPAPSEDITSTLAHWTLVEGCRGDSDSQPLPLYGLARRVALFGARAISNMPYARFCNLLTVDRSEIESLRGIQRLIKDYETKAGPPRPLSIAVFGPPGSGKSFAIKQITRAVLGEGVPILEFNLSQFSGPEGLICAFHQVRDKVLEGRTPFVFWDEFDSKGLMWLQYLLAPMQDGKFMEGQICHPIGKCVFVFAGGTSFDMENFVPPDKDTEKGREFKLVKGPDFVSRLSGYLNVLGPNRRQTYDKKENRWMDADNPVDICFPVRRALGLIQA